MIEIILDLKEKIENLLLPLIDRNYVLWEVPYYSNVGDLLIWEGELSFLQKSNYRCLNMASSKTCTFPNLSSDVLILLQGGGNFGDIWREIQDFRLKVIRRYPNNKIIIFPQTVFYENVNTLSSDAYEMGLHRHLIICARDHVSYNILRNNFKNEILLVPDMAFCISPQVLLRNQQQTYDKTLFLKRLDKELKDENLHITSQYPLTISDWPPMVNRDFIQLGMAVLQKLGFSTLTNWYGTNVYRKLLIKQGVKFVSQFREIYTTRLHVAILSILLQKPFFFLDNSYGKNKAFYETWLTNVDGINFIE